MRAVVKRQIKEGKIEEVLKVYEELAGPTREEVGCVSYAICKSQDEERVLAAIEEWADMDAFEAHLKSAHYLKLGPKLNDLTEKKTVDKYDQLI